MRPTHRTLRAAAALLLAALAGDAASQRALAAQGGGEDDDRLYAFQIYDTQAARALADEAREHLEAERWSEALLDLQRLIEEHPGEVLGGTKPRPQGATRPSENWVHRGAAEWATSRLFELDPDALELYRKRYAERAQRALSAAVEHGDRAGLTVTARRWPVTEQALRAWWALGDLELELGNTSDGFRAWGRGLASVLGRPGLELERPAQWRAALEQLQDRVDHADREHAASASSIALWGAGMLARVEYVLSILTADGEGGEHALNVRRDVTALTPRFDYGRPLREDTDGWPKVYQLPQHPFRRSGFRLFPARLGDTIFINTTRDLIAVGAYTGEEQWRAGSELLGWNKLSGSQLRDFTEAIDLRDMLAAPAAAHGVVVAALQIPYRFEDEDRYGELKIIKVIPERRLFAFDAQSGALLWHTLPPPLWDGESGTFAERVTMVGPPVIAGSRVLVPAARLRGRIEFQVGCFDLFTGELLWSTPLITGQRGLNMFGRSMREFSAPPVLAVGNRVVVLSQLGVLAALDLFTGEMVWETLYPQIVIKPTQYYEVGALDSVWLNAPPVVVGGTIVATPMDSNAAIGVDLETGAVAWSYKHKKFLDKLKVGADAVRLLVGADENRVYLSGRRLVAFESVSGLHRGPPTRLKWMWPVGDNLSTPMPRPVLGRDRLYAPTNGELVSVDLASGRALDRVPWQSAAGNLLLGDGVLYTLSSFSLSGYFEWQAMVDRAEAEARRHPDDLGRAQTLALLHLKRGKAEMLRNEFLRARPHLVQARRVLERHVPSAGPEAPPGSGDARAHPIIRATLHEVLREEADNLRLRGDAAQALRKLRRARPLAPTRRDACDTLLVEQEVLRGRDLQGWRDVLALLLERYGDMATLFETERSDDAHQSWRGNLVPIVTRLSTRDHTSLARLELPIGLWVRIERAQSLRRSKSAADRRREYEDLFHILWDHGEHDILSLRAGEWARHGIGEKVAAGEREGFAPFEQRAQVALQRAEETADLELLESIPERFPHSRAADRSNDLRLELYLASGDAEVVAEIVLGGLAEDWHPREASEREVRHLLRLARVLGEAGNVALRSGLVSMLARHHPQLRADLAGVEGESLARLRERWQPPPERPPAAASATFGAGLRAGGSDGGWTPLIEVPPAPGQTGHVLLFTTRSQLSAFGVDTGAEPADGNEQGEDQRETRSALEPLWSDFTPPARQIARRDHAQRVAVTPGRVHLASAQHLYTKDRETGEDLWSWTSRSRSLMRIVSSDGVVVVVERVGPSNADGSHRIVGLDAVSGIELWRIKMPAGHRYWPYPIVGEGYMVLLPRGRDPASVFDLFTGRQLVTFETGEFDSYSAQAAWIEDGRVVLPRMLRAAKRKHNFIEAYDLARGSQAWRGDYSDRSGRPRELTGIVEHAGTSYLVLEPLDDLRGRRTGLYELNVQLGAIGSTPKLELEPGERAIGLREGRRIELSAPFLFVLRPPTTEGGIHTLKAVDIRFGRAPRWQQNLSRRFAHTFDMPMPAVSATTVAVAFRTREERRRSGATRTELVFFDRISGERLDSRTLPPDMTNSDSKLQMTALGDMLFVTGYKQMEILR